MAFSPSRLCCFLGISLWVALAPAGAQVTDLVVTDSGADAVLTWTTGTPPFRVLRSQSPTFSSENRLVAEGLLGLTATDVGAIEPGEPDHFYVVLGDGDADPPGYVSSPPVPIAFITSISPDSGAPGDVVTIDGGNFDSGNGAAVVAFTEADEIADVLSSSPTQLVVVVPPGTLTGEVRVCISGRCSNPGFFQRVVASGFQDLSSIAFERGTGSLWVADRGSVDRVLELPRWRAAGG
ncbi:MAG: hypothetical protein HC897_07190, partial [Thermoanaerobaculia bacterium]|nr:hypothetical protein [Thermoanaerobaculia bacterium]